MRCPETQHVFPAHGRLSEIAIALAACPGLFPRDLGRKAEMFGEATESALAASLRADVARLAK